MARPLQLLSLLSRVGALSPMPSATFTGRRFVSKGVNRTWTGPTQRDRTSTYSNEGEDELEDVEDKLQALLNEGRKRQKTVKYHTLRRKMTPPGPPERSLTWDAIEQIRYLKAEQPEEWTVKRLAEGFSVSPDVILRVLRTKFIPSPERKAKQDTKVMVELNQQTLPPGVKVQERQRLTGNSAAAILPPGNTESTVVPMGNQTLTLRGDGSGSLTTSPVPVAALGRSSAADTSKQTLVKSAKEENTASRATEEEEEEESWDGQVLTEEQLEQCMETLTLSPVVQVGNDFFDVEGKFLYRI